MTLDEFKTSTTLAAPPNGLDQALKALWYDGQGDWHRAHDLADAINTRDGAWIHAYLHRKEGDTWNADYWYRRASRTRPNISLEAEWENLVEYFLTR